MQATLIIVVILVVALAGYGQYYVTMKRRKLLADWAAAKGWSFNHNRDGSLEDRYPLLSCLRNGSKRYGYNFVRGEENGRSIACFDYHYQTGSGKNKQHHYFSAAILSSPVPLKKLSIRPEGFLDKLSEFFGMDDIDFESAEFSRRFHVKAPDRKWAYDVLHQRAIEFLLAMPEYSIQFGLREAIVYRSAIWSPRKFEEAAELLRGLLDHLPAYVVEQQEKKP